MQAEDEIHRFLEQIKPNGLTDTSIFSLQEYGKLRHQCFSAVTLSHPWPLLFISGVLMCCGGLELTLERERETFRIATVEPVHQLRDDLCFRLGEVQHQQLNENPSSWEHITQEVSV